MKLEAIEETVVTCVKEVLPEAEFDSATPLEEVGMDSMNYIRLVVELEDSFGIEIQDQDISLDNFASVAMISQLVSRYIQHN